MRYARLIRDERTDHGTFGVLTAGPLVLETAEPPDRHNEPRISCIPEGEYRVRLHISPRFGRVLAVLGVKDRSHILIHAGNLAGDRARGYCTHTAGCLLPGLRRGHLTVNGRPQRAVLGSRTALRHLMEWAGAAPFELQIWY